MKFGIISDIHEDLESLVKAFRLLNEHKCNEIICLGDIVGVCVHYKRYLNSRNANECLRLVRENCTYVVVGNHDLYAARIVPEFNGGFNFPNDWYHRDIKDRQKVSEGSVWLYEDEFDSDISEENKHYIASLPEFVITENNGLNILFSHFLFPDITGSSTTFPANKTNLAAHFDFLRKQKCSMAVCGHMHAEGIIRSREAAIPTISFLQKPFDFLHFGDYKLRKKMQCLAVPAVANTDRQNGVAIIDTDKQEIHTFKIMNEY